MNNAKIVKDVADLVYQNQMLTEENDAAHEECIAREEMIVDLRREVQTCKDMIMEMVNQRQTNALRMQDLRDTIAQYRKENDLLNADLSQLKEELRKLKG